MLDSRVAYYIFNKIFRTSVFFPHTYVEKTRFFHIRGLGAVAVNVEKIDECGKICFHVAVNVENIVGLTILGRFLKL